MYMSAVLKQKGHTVEVFIEDAKIGHDIYKDLSDFRPDIVGFSVLTPEAPWSIKASRKVKEVTDALVVWGNVHAMVKPEIVESLGVDIVCLIEGETPLTELAARIDDGRSISDIPGMWVKSEGTIHKNPDPGNLLDIDDQPHHDRGLYDKYSFFQNSPVLRFMLGKGCPFQCSFCANTIFLQKFGKDYIRKRDPMKAIEELKAIVAERNPKRINFLDEVFWVKDDWLREFLHLYKEHVGVPFTANYRFGPIKEADVKLMSEAGARIFLVATESADEKVRNGLLNKPVKDEIIFKTAKLMNKYNIMMSVSCFFGLPDETVEKHIINLPFFRKLKPKYLWTTFLQPFPGLAISETPEILAMSNHGNSFESTFHHDVVLDGPDRVRITNLKKIYFLLMIWPWSEWFFLKIIKINAPLLFNVLFVFHYAYYVFHFERLSFSQFMHHIRLFGIRPLLNRVKALNSTTEGFSKASTV
jgi:radical SAM superfamily enzyme YgiQ (UPF0313 family)